MRKTPDHLGDIHMMVNDAGFIRDKTIFSMSNEEFAAVVRGHLRSHFINMRNATAYWRNQAKAGVKGHGRLIGAASEAAC